MPSVYVLLQLVVLGLCDHLPFVQPVVHLLYLLLLLLLPTPKLLLLFSSNSKWIVRIVMQEVVVAFLVAVMVFVDVVAAFLYNEP